MTYKLSNLPQWVQDKIAKNPADNEIKLTGTILLVRLSSGNFALHSLTDYPVKLSDL